MGTAGDYLVDIELEIKAFSARPLRSLTKVSFG